MAARRAGLQRSLDDIPSQKESASGVIDRIASTAPSGTRRRTVAPSHAAPAAGPARVVRLKVVGHPAPAPPRPAAKRRPQPRRRAAPPPPPPPPPPAEEAPREEASAEGKRGARSGRGPEVVRAFYERLGREVSKVFGDTVRRVFAAGRGAEEVVPQLLSRVMRAYGGMPSKLQEGLGSALKAGSDLWDPATWEGLIYLLRSSAEMQLDTMRRRRLGLYDVDEFGLDDEYLARVRPLFRFLYHTWFRVTTTGLENVPPSGRVLFVANHSGVLPYDGGMVASAIWEEHPNPRLVRALHLEWFVGVPFVAPFLQKTGQVMANPENGERLLSRDHLVTVFPEGLKGVGKLFKNRYQLARFGRGGFIRMAIRGRAPIIPVSVVGAEEIHPVLMQMDFIAKPLRLPYLPITPTFPLLGPLGLVPLPSKWYLHFGKPIDLTVHDPEDANDFHLVSQLSDQVRTEIQTTIHELRARRKSVFGKV